MTGISRVAAVLAAVLAAGWAELRLDFSKQQLDAEKVEQIGARDCLVREDQGLKVAIPAGKTDANTGIVARTQVVGDFEITAGFELIEVPKPEKGDGAGAVLFIGDGESRGASLQRVRTPRDKNLFVTDNWLRTADGKTHHKNKEVPTEAKSGSLRITRKGATITFWAADSGSDDFRELGSAEFTAQPVRAVRIYGQPGRAPSAVTVCFSNLVLRAESLWATNQAPPASRPALVTWVLVLFFVVLPLGTGGGFWIWKARRHRKAAAPLKR